MTASCRTMHPVIVRAPTGTRTRAPTGGSGMAYGTLYVRRSRNGTGTATATRRKWKSLKEVLSLTAQNRANLFHVFPHFPLRGRRPKQVRRVIRWDQHSVAVPEFTPANPRDGIVGVQQTLCGEFAERDDHLRLHSVNLTKQERLALLDFVRFGIAVTRRPALDHVGDINILAPEADRLDDFRQQLTGPADERLALHVFVGTGSLADEHQISLRVADAEDHLRAAQCVELAPRAIGAQVVADDAERDHGFNGFSGFNRFRRYEFCRFCGFYGFSGFTTRSPFRFQTDAVDAELFEELEMCLQRFVHWEPRTLPPHATSAAVPRDRESLRPHAPCSEGEGSVPGRRR